MSDRFFSPSAFLLVCSAAMAQPAPPATQTSDPFDTHDGPPMAAAMPTLPAGELLSLSLVDGMIGVQTVVPTTAMKRFSVSGIDTPVEVMVFHRGKPASQLYTPEQLRISFTQQSPTGHVQTNISAMPISLSLDRTIERSDANEQIVVQFMQSAAASQEPLPVRLFVQRITPSSAGETQKWTAESFLSFIRSYPAETTLYVRPIVEALAPQPQLFKVDDRLATSVFPQIASPDPAFRQKVLDLVALLNADDFKQRQEAGEKLEALGAPAAPILNSLDRDKLLPEQLARIDVLLAAAKPAFEANVEKLRSEPGFLLDCLMSANPALREAALQQLRKVVSQPVLFSNPADESARIREVYALRKQLTPDLLLSSSTTQPATQRVRPVPSDEGLLHPDAP